MRRLIEGLDYVVIEIPFPNNAADGAIVSSPDGIATICINANVCQNRKLKAYRHELSHLMHDDLYSDETIVNVEERADREGELY